MSLSGNINPVNLKGLRQALFVLQSLENGMNADRIAEEFQGDIQLVEIWTCFLLHNGWIEKTNEGKFSATDKGKEWRTRLPDVEA